MCCLQIVETSTTGDVFQAGDAQRSVRLRDSISAVTSKDTVDASGSPESTLIVAP
jgi:hypothetical protein